MYKTFFIMGPVQLLQHALSTKNPDINQVINLLRECRHDSTFDVNCEYSGKTLLALAIENHNNHPDLINVLLECEQLDTNILQKTSSQIPLTYFVSCWRAQDLPDGLCKLIDDPRTDVNKWDRYNQCIFSYALQNAKIQLCQMLLDMPSVKLNVWKRQSFQHLSTDMYDMLIGHPRFYLNVKDVEGAHFLIHMYTQLQHNQESLFGLMSKAIEKDGTDTNVTDKGGKTLLILMLYSNHAAHEQLVEMLIDRSGPHINQVANDGEFALSRAWLNGNKSLVKKILEHKEIDVNAVNTRNETALNICASYGYRVTEEHIDILKMLLAQKDIKLNVLSSSNQSALSGVISVGAGEMFDLLLDHKGVNLNLLSKDLTPLMQCVKELKYVMADKLMLLSNCDANIANGVGQTALILAVKLFGEKSHPRDRHLNLIKQLLKRKGIKVNIQDQTGNTALHYCSDPELLDLFLEHPDVDISITNNKGLTRMRRAIKEHDSQVIGALRCSGKYNPMKCGERDGLTDIMWCVLPETGTCKEFNCRDEGIFEQMVEWVKKDIRQMTFERSQHGSLLHCLMKSGGFCRLSKVKKFCDQMHDIKDANGRTYLHQLCCSENPVVQPSKDDIDLLCEFIKTSTADHVNIQDRDRYTALMYAVQNKCQYMADIVVAILRHPENCDLAIQNKFSQTVIDILEANREDIDPKILSVFKPYMGCAIHLKQLSLMDGIQFLRCCIDKSTLSLTNRNYLHVQVDGFESDVKVMETGREYQMKEEHREKLLCLRPYLLENVSPDRLLDYLVSKRVFDEDEEQAIRECCPRRKQVQKLLSVLPLKGSEAYDHFLNGLKEYQPYIADTLEDFRPGSSGVTPYRKETNPAMEMFNVSECLFLLSNSIEKKLLELTESKQ